MNLNGFSSDRRWTFIIFNAFLLALGAMLMAARITAHGWTLASAGLFLLFLVLQAQIVYGFVLGVTGWWIRRRGGDPVRINQTIPPEAMAGDLPATAIVMPIFNEEVGRVFQGLGVIYESLEATQMNAGFDFFILSDTSDTGTWIAEEQAWFELCKRVQGFGRIFYRKRRVPLHHKSGNVADFCRRWGTRYRYLVVLDADSIMAGSTLVRLVRLMEQNPRVGIIQTGSRIALGRSLFQRINQFATHAYGPLFATGANFWQLDNANFYGHNAIIRVEPFMRYCAMPELPPSGRLGRRILSHDTVEAALMRRAGYEVWGDHDLGGSYEESPPHLPASLQRDRRWCQGNMQHVWFLCSRGLTMPRRVNILLGILAYASSPLWLLFLLFSPVLFLGGSAPGQNTFLFAGAMLLLLLPKVLAAQDMMAGPEHRQTAGGVIGIAMSILGETAYSMILAPILMLFYTQFVWSSFFGGSAGWGRQRRKDDAGPAWRECVRLHASHTILALAGGGLVALWLPAMLPWVLLVLVGPILAIPFSRLTASNKLGILSRRCGLFLVPEETQPPWELRQFGETAEPSAGRAIPGAAGVEDLGLAHIVLDPRANCIHISLLPERRRVPLHTHEQLITLGDQLLRNGPSALSAREKRILLWDADSMLRVHQKLWNSPMAQLHQTWQHALGNYLQGVS